MSILLQAKNISKSFGNKQALMNVSFEIHKGAPVALVGPNGAGKTTLFSILCGYLGPTSGQVELFGRAPNHSSNLSRLGALPQDAQLDPRFAISHQLKFYAQLQGFSRKNAQIEAERVLDLVQLSDVLNEKPLSLSHGMRKRVAIAQTLIGSPELILLDEATAGLDPLHAREVRSLVANLADETTFILSSHDLNELERLCEQVLFLENGVLKQHQTSNADNSTHCYTLRMAQEQPNIGGALQAISADIKVTKISNKEYVITAPASGLNLSIDVEVLKLCHQNNWHYKQLINGKTLEDKLFS